MQQAAKVRRYQGRVDSYRQNSLFEISKAVFRELDHKEERCDDDQTVAKVTKVGVFSEDVGMEFGIKSALSW